MFLFSFFLGAQGAKQFIINHGKNQANPEILHRHLMMIVNSHNMLYMIQRFHTNAYFNFTLCLLFFCFIIDFI